MRTRVIKVSLSPIYPLFDTTYIARFVHFCTICFTSSPFCFCKVDFILIINLFIINKHLYITMFVVILYYMFSLWENLSYLFHGMCLAVYVASCLRRCRWCSSKSVMELILACLSCFHKLSFSLLFH